MASQVDGRFDWRRELGGLLSAGEDETELESPGRTIEAAVASVPDCSDRISGQCDAVLPHESMVKLHKKLTGTPVVFEHIGKHIVLGSFDVHLQDIDLGEAEILNHLLPSPHCTDFRLLGGDGMLHGEGNTVVDRQVERGFSVVCCDPDRVKGDVFGQ